ncbi:MAG: hypothetical protein ACYS7Y_30500 [Planctomycetota bacterium]|jgi:hypothetical protein
MKIKFSVPCGLTPDLTDDFNHVKEFTAVRLLATEKSEIEPGLDVMTVLVPCSDVTDAMIMLGDLVGTSCCWWLTEDDLVAS